MTNERAALLVAMLLAALSCAWAALEGDHVVSLCRCGRPTDKRGKTCCQMCWVDYGPGCHSRPCRRRAGR